LIAGLSLPPAEAELIVQEYREQHREYRGFYVRNLRENRSPTRRSLSEFQRRHENEREEIRRWFISGRLRARIDREERRERRRLWEQEAQSTLPTDVNPSAPPPLKKPKLDPERKLDLFGPTSSDSFITVDNASSSTEVNEDILQSPPEQEIAVSAAQVIPIEETEEYQAVVAELGIHAIDIRSQAGSSDTEPMQ